MKKQIELLNGKLDSLNEVLLNERLYSEAKVLVKDDQISSQKKSNQRANSEKRQPEHST